MFPPELDCVVCGGSKHVFKSQMPDRQHSSNNRLLSWTINNAPICTFGIIVFCFDILSVFFLSESSSNGFFTSSLFVSWNGDKNKFNMHIFSNVCKLGL